MKAILLALAFFFGYVGFILLMIRGKHPHGKSDEQLDAEMDVQMENLKQRTQAQLDALRRRGGA